MQHLSLSPRYRTRLLLVFIGVACVALNLTKAFHIDDIAHVQIARAILADPLHPMSGLANWVNSAEPIHQLNQPHLFFYLMASVMALFGESALALHGLMAIVSIGVMFAFYTLARQLVPRLAVQATALFVLGPCFLPGQNVMVDVPLVGIWIAFFLCILRAHEGGVGLYAAAGGLVAAACLVKYTSLVLLPVMVFIIVARRHWKMLWVPLIPVLALLAWSGFNMLDYGGIHLLERPVGEQETGRFAGNAADWIAGLGATAAFSVILLSRQQGRVMRRLLGLGLLAAGAVWVSLLAGESRPPWQRTVLWAMFYGNGVLVLSAAVLAAVRVMKKAAIRGQDLDRDAALLLTLWWAGAFGFTVLFAPFMAVRHVLLAMPAILLLVLSAYGDRIARGLMNVAVVLTVVLGLTLAYSDYCLADVYRRSAAGIKARLPGDARIVSVGHWGWQWYSARQGMVIYDSKRTDLMPGDYLVMPGGVDQQQLADAHVGKLQMVDTMVVPANLATVVRTMGSSPFGGYYSFSLSARALPWFVSRAPLETFYIFRVVETGRTR